MAWQLAVLSVLLLSLALHLVVQPFQSRTENFMESVGVMVLVFTYSMQNVNESEVFKPLTPLIRSVLVILNVALVVSFISLLLWPLVSVVRLRFLRWWNRRTKKSAHHHDDDDGDDDGHLDEEYADRTDHKRHG